MWVDKFYPEILKAKQTDFDLRTKVTQANARRLKNSKA